MGLAPEDQASRDLEVAISRARGEDLGTRENPLTLSGSTGMSPNSAGIMPPEGGREDDYLPPAERAFSPESKEWREAQSAKLSATQNRQKAERIRDYLLSEGMNMDPNTRRDLMQGADWLDKISDSVEERFERQKERREDRAMASDKAVADYEKERHKATAAGERVQQATLDKSLESMRRHYDDLEKMYIDPKNEDGKEDIFRAMKRSYMAQAKAQNMDVNDLQAEVGVLASMGRFDEVRDRLETAGVPQDQVEEAIAGMGG
jgi:hypothetical protein